MSDQEKKYATEHKNLSLPEVNILTNEDIKVKSGTLLQQGSDPDFYIWQQRCYTYITTLDLGLLILSQARVAC